MTNPIQEAFNTERNKLEALNKKFPEMEKLIRSVVDSIAQNRSFFTKTALLWGKIPLWLKIIGGLVLSAPSLIIGIVFHLVVPYVVCALTLLVYIGCSYILDNHHNREDAISSELTKTLLELNKEMNEAIESLHDIARRIATEVVNFKEENIRLTLQINELRIEIKTFETRVDKLKSTVSKLSDTQKNLGSSVDTLQADIATFEEALTAINSETEVLRNQIAEDQNTLDKVITELDRVKTDLGTRIRNAEETIGQLGTAAREISARNIKNVALQENFMTKLDGLIADTTKGIAAINERRKESYARIAAANKKLDHLNEQYNLLIKCMENSLEPPVVKAPGSNGIFNPSPAKPGSGEANLSPQM